jgi:hypothetical protein
VCGSSDVCASVLQLTCVVEVCGVCGSGVCSSGSAVVHVCPTAVLEGAPLSPLFPLSEFADPSLRILPATRKVSAPTSTPRLRADTLVWAPLLRAETRISPPTTPPSLKASYTSSLRAETLGGHTGRDSQSAPRHPGRHYARV